MIYRSVRIDLYQDRKIVRQYMLVMHHDLNIVFRKFQYKQQSSWAPLSAIDSFQRIEAYNEYWKYGNKETNHVFKGYTKVRGDKRFLTPKVYDGAIDLEQTLRPDNTILYKITKEDYVPHSKRTII